MKKSTSLFLAVVAALGACASDLQSPGQTAVREVRLSQPARFGRSEVVPTRILEDSRCPTGVQCIQAGTVRIEARMSDGNHRRTGILGLGVPVRLAEGWVSLVRVCPYPVHPSPIRPADYRFSVILTTAATASPADLPGCHPDARDKQVLNVDG